MTGLIVFLLGPSGVGKSELANFFQAVGWVIIDIDQRNGFHANNLHREWHTFSTQLDVAPLLATLQQRMAEPAPSEGLIVSFPSTRILTMAQVQVACLAGIQTVVLWGNKEQCLASYKAREENLGNDFNENRYWNSNRKAFELYGADEFEHLRLATFPRRARGELAATIKERIRRQTLCLK